MVESFSFRLCWRAPDAYMHIGIRRVPLHVPYYLLFFKNKLLSVLCY
jgi:hypothetical protein